MKKKLNRTLRLVMSLLVMSLVAFPATDVAAAAAKRKSRKARTTKVRKKKRSKKRSSSKPALPTVVLGTTGPIDAPEPFVTTDTPTDAPEGLDGRTLAIWPSHGKYFSGTWLWQRPRLFGTVEDLLSRSFVDPYLVPMLENAGAYVMLPRERDFSTAVTIIDHDWSSSDGHFATHSGRHKWKEMPDSSGYAHRGSYIVQGENPFVAGSSGRVETVTPADSTHQSVAQWFGTAPQAGRRAVYVSYQSYPNSATDATYTVNHLGGATKVTVNQRMGGGRWVYLGTFPFSTNNNGKPLVTLSNVSEDEDAVVSADAVRIGGGMGTVARGSEGHERTSGLPAYLEGARYFLQAAGYPDSVYSINQGNGDYVDDYTSRALWVNNLTGESECFPDSAGLQVPVDMVLALHTDAGIRTDSTTIGTLGLYSTDSGNPLGNGTSRYANRDLTEAVTSQVVNDIRQLYDPNWTSRGNLDRRYYEVRKTKVPAMIIELLSHQNFEDMKRAWDPQFRFLVSRAIYKGILKFLAGRYDLPYTVQPLPVESFAIKADGKGYYTLSWQPTPDPLEPSAIPTSYIIYEATIGSKVSHDLSNAPLGEGAWWVTGDAGSSYYRPVAVSEIPQWSTLIDDDLLHAYYIVAVNDGGQSFPSEILTLYDRNHAKPSVEVVNGYTRVAAPQWVDGEEFAGFDFANNYGVPDGTDVHFIGNQYDTDPTSKLLSGDRPGFGASYDTESAKLREGNTHDYTIIHGLALRNAGRGFVSSSLKAFENGKNSPRVVDLILGQQRTTRKAASQARYFQPFTPDVRKRLADHRRQGGALLLSGAHLASEVFEADSLTRDTLSTFTTQILGYEPYILCDTLPKVPIATRSMEVEGTGVSRGLPVVLPTTLLSYANSQRAGAGNPQAISPTSGTSTVIARYSDTQMPAAIAVEADKGSSFQGAAGRAVVASFPIEAMEEGVNRDTFIATAIEYLIGPEAPSTGLDNSAEVSKEPVKASKKGKKGKKEKKKTEKKEKVSQPSSTAKTGSSGPVPPPKKKAPSTPKAVPHPPKH